MNSILVGVDSSEPSRRALRFALTLARARACPVSVVHVLNTSHWFTIPTLPDLEGLPLKVKEQRRNVKDTLLRPLLEQMHREQLLGGLDVQGEVYVGRPSEVLSHRAEKNGHDLIVVARTGDSGMKQAIFGSTASRLVQHAPVPVTVVP